MKILLFLTLVAFASAKSALNILGQEECTRGPGYWCRDYKSAKQCGSVKYCTEHHWKKQIKGTACDECKTVVTQVHAYLADNMTETEVIQALDAVCSFLGAYAPECKALVNTYGKEMMEMIKQYTANPDIICKMMGLCSSAGKFEFESIKKANPIVFGGSKKVAEPKTSALCIVCEFAMTEIERLLGTETSEDKIISTVEKVCSYLPSTIKTECDALITEYGKEIIHMLINQLKPKEICSTLKLCSASSLKTKPVVAMKMSKNGVECEACQLIVTYVDSLLKNNRTEAEIKQALDAMCSYLGSYRTECDAIVGEYMMVIIKYLSQMSADVVCKAIGLCSTKGVNVKMNHIKLDKSIIASSATCSMCKFAVSYIDTFMKNKKTQAEIATEMEKVCSFLGQYKAECKGVISSYLPMIMEYLATLTPDQVCEKIQLCSAKTLMMSVERPIGSKKAGNYCSTCKVVVSYVDSLIKDSKTEAEIVTLVEKLCSYLGTYKTECDTIVAAYLPEILQLLAQELSPDLVCKGLGLCTSKSELKVQKTAKVGAGQYCQICEVIVSYVEKLLNNNTEAEIVSLVDHLCSYLGSYKAECNSLVKSYVPEIIELLKKELTPALVCKELGLCTSVRHLMKQVKIEDFRSQLKAGAGCQLCEVIVGYVDSMLKDKKTQQEITVTLEQVCTYFGSYKAECQSLMSSYLPMIFQYLEQELTPDLVCKELGLCTAAKKLLLKSAVVQKPKAESGSTCEICESVVSYVDGLISTKTEAEIAAEVDKLCSYLGSYQAECKSLVDAYLPQILELLKKELTPNLVCKELGLCTAVHKLAKKLLTSKGYKDGAGCTLCKVVVGYIDNQLKDSKTEAEITSLVEKLCNYLGSYKAECDSLASQYLPMIFKLLAEELSPALVCKELTLCTTNAPNPRMVLMKKAMPVTV